MRASIAWIAGEKQESIEGLRAVILGFDDRQMVLHAASARMALGRLAGGDEGQELERVATDTLKAQGVVAPERYAAHYAPGFGLQT